MVPGAVKIVGSLLQRELDFPLFILSFEYIQLILIRLELSLILVGRGILQIIDCINLSFYGIHNGANGRIIGIGDTIQGIADIS